MEDDLILAWQHFANSLPEAERATAERMRTLTPRVLDDGKFVISVGNPFVQKTLNKMRSKILTFIGKELNREELEMEIEVDRVDNAMLTFSKSELFSKMLKEHPSFAKLNELFALELN